ncbi:MAG: hypothetical protein J6H21_01815 [Firmicutes bacterium]|nr:hypothetical protein [Bacillota bacterium]
MDIGAMFKIKDAWGKFTANHPRIPGFLDSIKDKGFVEGQEIAIAVRYPDGTEFKTGIKVQKTDLDLLDLVK